MMDEQPPLDFTFTPNLSDEAAYEICEFLQALSLAFEAHYFGQIHRHQRAIHPTQQDLADCSWEEKDKQSF